MILGGERTGKERDRERERERERERKGKGKGKWKGKEEEETGGEEVKEKEEKGKQSEKAEKKGTTIEPLPSSLRKRAGESRGKKRTNFSSNYTFLPFVSFPSSCPSRKVASFVKLWEVIDRQKGRLSPTRIIWPIPHQPHLPHSPLSFLQIMFPSTFLFRSTLPCPSILEGFTSNANLSTHRSLELQNKTSLLSPPPPLSDPH